MSVVVPDVTGLTQAEATAALVEIGLVLGDVTEAYNETIAVGLVVSQEPDADEEALEGSAVDLVLSKGQEPVTPSGVLGTVVHGLRQAVAASSTFRTAVDANSPTEALAYIHAWVMDESTDPPFAFIAPGREYRERVANAGAYPEAGEVLLALVLPITKTDDLDAFYAFDNTRNSILSEIAASAESGGYVHIRSIELNAEDYGLWGAQEKRARGKSGIQAWHTITWGF